jgi:hypothetical protein
MPHSLPCFRRSQPIHYLAIFSVDPSEGWNRHKLATANGEEAFHNYELQDFARYKKRQPSGYMARSGQVGCGRLDRLKNNERRRK